MALSAPGIAYRNLYKALSDLVGGRVAPFSEAEGVGTPHIRVWLDKGGQDEQAAGEDHYALVFNVVATDLTKDVVLELQEDIHQALDDRGIDDRGYDRAGHFAPQAGDRYAILNITEGRVIDGHFFEEDKSTRFSTAGWQYALRVGEV